MIGGLGKAHVSFVSFFFVWRVFVVVVVHLLLCGFVGFRASYRGTLVLL
jgi:hypothetical protein